MKQKALSLFLAVIMAISLLSVSALAAGRIVDSGTCGANGDNLTWTLDHSGTLTISGTGAMMNYDQPDRSSPWDSHRINGTLKTVTISDGVTSIGHGAFSGCYSVTSVSIPNSVTSIGKSAFWYCSGVERVSMGTGVTSIGADAFNYCHSLTDVYYSGSGEQWKQIQIGPHNESLLIATLHTNDLFADVRPGDWFYNDVAYVSEKGIMNGFPGDVFLPNKSTTRGMIVTTLWRMEGEPAADFPLTFADVPAGKWFTKAIQWAAANQIVSGYSPQKFGPNDPITREQMATIFYRYASLKQYDVSGRADLSGFSDVDKLSRWAVTPMSWANSAKLIQGVGGNRLSPTGTATRAQAAAILHRFCEQFNA